MFRIIAAHLAVALVLWQVVTATRRAFECTNNFQQSLFWIHLRDLHHSGCGVQYLSIRYPERLAEAGIEPSVDSVGINSSGSARPTYHS